MKDKILFVILSSFVLLSVGLFAYGCWYVGKKISYEFFYEDQVMQTIEEYMQEREKPSVGDLEK